jgi:hypothetical protein
MVSGQAAPPAPANLDLDHDGFISILDLTLMAQHFAQPAEKCLRVTRVHHPVPVISQDINGNPISIEGYSLPDPDQDPTLIAGLLSGTPTFQCWP